MNCKKKLCVLIIFVLLIVVNLYVFAGQILKTKIVVGDVDKNNTVNKKDAELILEKVSEEKNGKVSTIEIPSIADTNSDNKVDLTDVVDIMRYSKAKAEGEETNNPEWISKLEQKVEFGILEEEIKIDLSEKNTDKVTIQGSNYGNITYKIEDEEIAKIDSNGNIEGKKNGETKLIVTEDKANLSVNCKVIVQTSPTTITLNKTSATLDLSGTKTVTLTSTITPSTANVNTGITWTSSNTNVATVNSSGVVTGKANGTATITATTNGKTATCSITVKTSVTSISLSSTSAYLDISHTTAQLKETVNPNNATNKTLTWTSSNTNVATVDNSGKVTRVGTGTTTITAKATDGSNKSATCTVTVKKEKLIICGPSTVVRLAGRATVSGTAGDFWGIDYYDEFGYTVKASSTQAATGGVYENITNSTSNSSADLFFICQGGRGLRYFSGTSFNGKSVSQKNTSNVECFESSDNNGVGGTNLENLLTEGNTNNWHFTVAFVCSGNDLTQADMSKEIVDNIAQINADYCSYLAGKYSSHNFYVFPITPVDESNVAEGNNLLTHKYTTANSNNKKRYEFACALNDAVNAKTESNLKYANGFFLDLVENSKYVGTLGGRTCTGNKTYTKLNGKNTTTSAYRAYDGKHYNRWGCRIVMEQILVTCGVVDSTGIKLK